MYRAFTLGLVAFFILLLPPISETYSSSGAEIVAPNYKTKVKVKLLPTASFSTKISGEYAVINLDNNETIYLETSNTISFTQKDLKIEATVNKELITSTKGFDIVEFALNENNYVEISSISRSAGNVPVPYRGSFIIEPGNDGNPVLYNTLDMENYLRAVVPSEMPAYWASQNPKALEALKAQAVAARSYAYNELYIKNKPFILTTTSSQVYNGKSAEHALTDQAVTETAGIYAVYNNKPIEAFFHSSSGGFTENSEDVWTNPVPYIRGVADSYDKHPDNNYYGWTVNALQENISKSLNLSDKEMLLSLKPTIQTAGGSIKLMSATIYNKDTNTKSEKPLTVASPDRYRSFFGIVLKSLKFKVTNDSNAKIMMPDGSQQSADHLIGYKIQKSDGTVEPIEQQNITVKLKSNSIYLPAIATQFSFSGNGWGHGLGMSQWGARSMAEQGFTFDQILKYYYTGIEVKKLE